MKGSMKVEGKYMYNKLKTWTKYSEINFHGQGIPKKQLLKVELV